MLNLAPDLCSVYFKTIDHLTSMFYHHFVGILPFLSFEFQKFRISEILKMLNNIGTDQNVCFCVGSSPSD